MAGHRGYSARHNIAPSDPTELYIPQTYEPRSNGSHLVECTFVTFPRASHSFTLRRRFYFERPFSDFLSLSLFVVPSQKNRWIFAKKYLPVGLSKGVRYSTKCKPGRTRQKHDNTEPVFGRQMNSGRLKPTDPIGGDRQFMCSRLVSGGAAVVHGVFVVTVSGFGFHGVTREDYQWAELRSHKIIHELFHEARIQVLEIKIKRAGTSIRLRLFHFRDIAEVCAALERGPANLSFVGVGPLMVHHGAASSQDMLASSVESIHGSPLDPANVSPAKLRESGSDSSRDGSGKEKELGAPIDSARPSKLSLPEHPAHDHSSPVSRRKSRPGLIRLLFRSVPRTQLALAITCAVVTWIFIYWLASAPAAASSEELIGQCADFLGKHISAQDARNLCSVALTRSDSSGALGSALWSMQRHFAGIVGAAACFTLLYPWYLDMQQPLTPATSRSSK